VAQTYTHDSFGKTKNSTGSLTNCFRYTAREFHTETNLYYHRARYYDRATGKFPSEDPLHFLAGNGFFGGSGKNTGAAGSASLSGIYIADPCSPLGFTFSP